MAAANRSHKKKSTTAAQSAANGAEQTGEQINPRFIAYVRTNLPDITQWLSGYASFCGERGQLIQMQRVMGVVNELTTLGGLQQQIQTSGQVLRAGA